MREEMLVVLRDFGYVRVPDERSDSMTWRDEKHHSVQITGPPNLPVVTITDVHGRPHKGVEQMTLHPHDLVSLLP